MDADRLGAGLAWSDPVSGLAAEVRGRALLSHESAGFRERGFSVALAWDPTPGIIGTPEIGIGLSDSARDYRLGWRLGLARPGERVSLGLAISAVRRESVNDDREPEHEVGLRFALSW